MNAKKAKAARRKARSMTDHLPDVVYSKGRLGECTRGAYQAIKEGRVHVAV